MTLLDVLFDVRISFEHLRRVHFAEQHNRDPHNLDDSQLRETLDRFCVEGILTKEPPHDHPRLKEYGEWFEITPRGGELWESERMPVWERFVSGRHCPMRSGREIVSFRGVSAQICRESLQLYWEHFVRESRLGRLRLFRLTRHSLLSWKAFPTIHVAVGVPGESVPFDEYLRRDWSRYDRLRTCWSTVQQLQKFVGLGRAV